jgi:hypothetical protein
VGLFDEWMQLVKVKIGEVMNFRGFGSNQIIKQVCDVWGAMKNVGLSLVMLFKKRVP